MAEPITPRLSNLLHQPNQPARQSLLGSSFKSKRPCRAHEPCSCSGQGRRLMVRHKGIRAKGVTLNGVGWTSNGSNQIHNLVYLGPAGEATSGRPVYYSRRIVEA